MADRPLPERMAEIRAWLETTIEAVTAGTARELLAEIDWLTERLRVPCGGCPGCPTDCPDARDLWESGKERIAELEDELRWVYAKLYSAQKDLQEHGLPISNVTYMQAKEGDDD